MIKNSILVINTSAVLHGLLRTLQNFFKDMKINLRGRFSKQVMDAFLKLEISEITVFNTHYASKRNPQRKEKTLDQPWLTCHILHFD